jgi:hypothetical protein
LAAISNAPSKRWYLKTTWVVGRIENGAELAVVVVDLIASYVVIGIHKVVVDVVAPEGFDAAMLSASFGLEHR